MFLCGHIILYILVHYTVHVSHFSESRDYLHVRWDLSGKEGWRTQEGTCFSPPGSGSLVLVGSTSFLLPVKFETCHEPCLPVIQL